MAQAPRGPVRFAVVQAIYESERRRARIDLPLSVTENPLEAMIAAREVSLHRP